MARDSRRTIVVTGASRGLGRAMVDGFIERGHTVCGCARSAAAVTELAAEYGPPHRFDVVDVADDEQVGRWSASVIASHGPPDLLVNNAALINGNAPLWKVSYDEFSQLIDVNIKGVFSVVRHFLPAMVERRSGVVVNFSSGWGRSISPEVAPYCASKWGIEGLTRALAEELPQGMAAVPLNPGVVHTEMLESAFGTNAADYDTPDEWAGRAVPLLLGLGAKDNGQPLAVRSSE